MWYPPLLCFGLRCASARQDGAARSALLRAEPRLGITGPLSGTHLEIGRGDLCGVPGERRCATDAIRLHAPDFKRTPKNILFPGNKKVRFLQIFLINRKERKECREFLINLRAVFCSAGTFENSPQFQLRGGGQKEKVPEELLSPQSSH